ncbi:MAG: transketolase [Thermoplasmata archaeon M11B2D]|nr:MAG: transketolase [Thermoplasmata archaeon M11B2D]PNX53087.1 MAG: transketolase [Thermoplasmata archaeon M9B2D]
MKQHDEEYIRKLNLTAVKIRKHVIEMLYKAKSGHPGGSLSAVEAIVALYFHHMRHTPKNPCDPKRDRFVLSKGHAAPTLYAVLAECGYFDVKELQMLRQINCMLQGHPVCRYIPGVEASTGSLGHGLSFALGIALAGKLDKKDYRVYVMVGDGETDEGQIWEAATSASHYKLDNLTALIDRNFMQIDGSTEDVLRLESVRDRWSSFGWYVLEVDGHDIGKIIDALLVASEQKNQPTMIILNTVKGKGVSFMENNIDFHGVPPNEMEYKLAMKELDGAQKALEALV